MRLPLIFTTLILGATACMSIDVDHADSHSADKKAIIPQGMEWMVNDLHFSPAIVSNDHIFVSGVIAIQTAPGSEGMEQAIENAFKEIQLILSAAGADFDDVVDMVTYHVDLNRQKEIFNRIKDRYVKAPYPAWTALDIEGLWLEEAIVEIKVVARK